MKWMMTLTTLSLIGIVITGNSIYTEVKIFRSNDKPTEITASMYRSLIWHSDIYKDDQFLNTAQSYFSDGKIDTREYSKLTSLASKIAGPIIYIQETDEQLWHARLTYKKYLEEKTVERLASLH
ncbi:MULTISPECIES: hypothetical protein [Pseudoalteromonas]|jgi:predicted short-subunit dehydrogenase-like oxidoreductase (DUF2520 family)|uniref:Uncharacterized protein n=1 Tax=Pseudoalteromonas shioyasakiensis TaxID=1190813 RepID=A0ABT6TW02_9GAMM|nr:MULTISPECIES: hypothetical protein [Pseudoalteromonas]KPW04920.1 hypothetical protein AN213_00416 [Pseudoalteromonas sp. P1-8]MCO6353495.1 hypothetical protein [Pseudoalteromonas shioyasakiensis]MCO7205977.1 hypothetical protein [Pseudoalteromonas sp. CnMc7-37]MDI4650725.1 hypothetical protein [Pseudoalteromonas shioyasakiensis]MDI4668083.1 hypothetical protein [Pseudoalteromonas shioyasakiensis]|tara:strand:+ start:463 stop:834 length:372 start_codon:yes stop_codon:yes gene_type:complete